MSNYSQRREAWIKASIETGECIGTQRMADLLALALSDPGTMGKDTFSKARIQKVYEKLYKLQEYLCKAWQRGPEQDYYQDLLDRRLQQVFGEDFVPFPVRYPDIAAPRYDRREKR